MKQWNAGLVVAVAALAVLGATQGRLGAQAKTAKYSYVNKGQAVNMQPSSSLVALRSGGAGTAAFAANLGLKPDPLSRKPSFRDRGLTLYRTSAGKGGEGITAASVVSAAVRGGLETQPVFEQGGAVMVPADEVIVGFKAATSLTRARNFVSGYAKRLGLAEVRAHRKNAFIVKIGSPADGRAFAVSRAFSKLNPVSFAEPNFVLTLLHGDPAPALDLPASPPGGFQRGGPLQGGTPGPAPLLGAVAAAPNWQTILTENFEGSVPGWFPVSAAGSTDASPVLTTLRKHGGAKSLYMTGGGADGVPAPGPYPDNVLGGLQSPDLDLSGLEEAYAECWFYAKYETPGEQGVFDYALFTIFDGANSATLNQLIVGYTGDLTVDPTTKSGWRRVLARIPAAYRKAGVSLRFLFSSDGGIGAEGVYVDDVRVVGTDNVDTQPLGNDTYGGRGYELQNVGQLAALGNDSNDLNIPEAWAEQAVSSSVVVAVIDDGVELAHPDLTLVTSYDGATGQVGGGPASDTSNHGTACAGNVGAKRNNGIGTIGTAPGVKIMSVQNGQTFGDLASSIDVAVQHGAKVLSNSWGWVGTPSQDIENAIIAALAANRIVVFAAGNGPDRPPFTYETAFPGRLTQTLNIICVGASSQTDEHKSTSSSDGIHSWGSSYVGPGPDVMAPGPWSYTTDRLGALGYNGDQNASGVDVAYTHDFGGTSSSTPKVAGICALLVSRNPNLTPAQAKAALKNTAKDIEAAGADDKTGSGRVDALAAVRSLGGGTDPTITVTAPNGGESWPVGSSRTITWTHQDAPGNVKIDVSRNGPGGPFEVIVPSTVNDGSHAWTVTGGASTTARVRVSLAADTSVTDTSNAHFSITETAQTFTISGTVTRDGDPLAGVTVSAGGGRTDATDANGSYLIGNLPPATYTVTPTLAGHTFTPANAQVTVGPSKTQNFTAQAGPPRAPTVLEATLLKGGDIQVDWIDNADDEDGYRLEYKAGNGNFQEFPNPMPADTESTNVTGATGGVLYTFRVRAFRGNQFSAYSNLDSVTPPLLPPITPASLRARALSRSSIQLTWEDTSNNEETFRVEVKKGRRWVELGWVKANALGAIVPRLKKGTKYTFRVKARNAGGDSGPSNPAFAKTKKR